MNGAPVARRLTALSLAWLLGACASDPGISPQGDVMAKPVAFRWRPTSSFASLVTARSASVVEISTLRIGRDERAGVPELEFAPEIDFADRLAWPLPANARISHIRDLASGVILDREGVILTSAHVIANIDEAQVRLNDGRRFRARVIGSDRSTDVGLLQIEAIGLTPAVIGDSSRLVPGDWVAAIGAPFGFQGSVTAGVVSAVDRLIGGAGEIPFIQTDVAINPGSSGSPLFNSRGEVVAINSMIYSGSGGYMGLSFAVPINLAVQVAVQLRAHGQVRRAQVGAEFQEMTPALAQSFGLQEAIGALVVRVDKGGPAAQAGLIRGDVVTAFDTAQIPHFTDLLQLIAKGRPGSVVRVDVWRHAAKHTLLVTLAEPQTARIDASLALASDWGDGLGLSLGELTPAQHRQLGIDEGLMVRDATGLARSEGIRAGDLIVALNDAPLDRVADFRRSLSNTPPGRTIALLVLRDRRLAYVPIQLPPAPAKP
ncbi:trypsin-like peptidase domain-containing protein [Variovorax sp. J22R24]|uniref:trypsin-like peptidase domain-containing protein n=1 Tax=Variovorax gracilis TaxID=3053502 RepID=UPI002574C8F1|nr:trypsin-like peptidase domain-containing protein [Variovorax sp. J22R24]MDM0107738.1 trypsin-like peptidase domain-containing protein [Variovorax sp. J22R24]